MSYGGVRQRTFLREAFRRFSTPAPILSKLVYTGDGDRVTAHLFPEQHAFVMDKSPAKVAKCSRRAGKTMGVAAALVKSALDYPTGENCYIGPTRTQAKRLLWSKLKQLNQRYQLQIRFVETELEARFPNGSVIYVDGADKSDRVEKFRGMAFVLVVIDESASFKAHIELLVRDVLKPTLEDHQGSIALVGTPGYFLVGLFFEACIAKTGWSQHSWTILDNQEFPRWAGRSNWRERARAWLEELREREAFAEDDPTYIREWLGEWIIETATLVYRYDPDRNSYTNLPPKADWQYILGVDLGYDDKTAFVLVAFARGHEACYVVYCKSHGKMIAHDIGVRIAELRREFKPKKIVVDTGGLGKMVVQELRIRHRLPLVPAEKTAKLDHIKLVNSDLRKGLIKIQRGTVIEREWLKLQRDETGREDPRFDNHASDAFLYAWRDSLHYRERTPELEPEYGSEEYWKREEERMLASELAAARREANERTEDEELWG